MMKKGLLTALMTLLAVTGSWAVEIGGVNIPETMEISGESVVLNGVGIREKFSFRKDIYVAALYLPEKSADAEAIIAQDAPMAIRLQIVTGLIKSEDFIESTRAAFVESTGGNTAPIEKEIEKFISVFKSGISKKDIYDITYNPATGVEVFKNGSSKPAVVIEGMEIKKALFGIWVGERSEKFLMELRAAMLGL